MPRRRLVTLDEAVQAVVKRHGGVRAAERATGVDKSFISRLMNGHKVAPSAETLEALGLRAVPLYEVLKRPNVRAKAPTYGRRPVGGRLERPVRPHMEMQA